MTSGYLNSYGAVIPKYHLKPDKYLVRRFYGRNNQRKITG